MQLEEIYTLLGKVENGAEIVATLKGEFTKLRNEAASNRIAKNDVEKMLKELHIGTDESGVKTAEQIKQLMEALTAQHKSPGEVLPHLTELEKQVKDLNDRYTAAEKKAQEAEAKRIEMTKNAELIKALTDANAVSPSQIARILAGNVRAKDDGTLIYSDDGKTEKAIKDGVADYLKANTWAVVNKAVTGGGTHAPEGKENELSKQIDDIMKSV